jgi:glycosyltransferase involved in cell wall biosynthesis
LTYDRRMLRIGTSLAKAGYEVWLVGRLMPNSQPYDNQYIKSHRFSLFFNKGKLFYVEYNIRLFFWLLVQRVDIIGGIDLDSILPCYFSAKIRNILRSLSRFFFGSPFFPMTFGKLSKFPERLPIKVVYDAHELFSETPEVVRRPLIRRVWLAVERFIVPKVDAAYTVSQSVADEFERRYGRRFGLIRNLPLRENELKIKNSKLKNNETSQKSNQSSIDGVIANHLVISAENSVESPENSSFIIHHSSLKKIILYQGALNEGRGLEIAIEAMQFIDNAELWLIGEGDLSQELRAMSVRLGLQNKVKFLGFIVPDELPFYTAKGDIGLQISEDKGMSYRYSLANKFLDYIQAELPQIFTQFPEYQRINEQYDIGISIEKTDLELLLAALKRLLDDAEYYQQIKENCRKAAVDLCWENEEKTLIDVYRNL